MRMIIRFLRNYGKEVIFFLFVIYIIKQFKDFFGGSGSDAKIPGTILDQGLSVGKATITQAESMAIANNLYDAMANYTNLGFPGTDEDTIYHNLGLLKNQDDYNLVYNTFGLKPYSFDFGNASGIVNKTVNLKAMLDYELTNSEKQKIRNLYPHLKIF